MKTSIGRKAFTRQFSVKKKEKISLHSKGKKMSAGANDMSKYKNQPTVVDEILFASRKEAARYSELKMLQRVGIISDLRWQVPYELQVNGVAICKYIADFCYLDQSGREVIEDVKGQRSGSAYALYRLKAKLMLACHGIRIVEM
jgi:hypothetical protein